jgi:NAD(P)-dependent dehydrogenase (short-subunit alcohol dehydrogenase family)
VSYRSFAGRRVLVTGAARGIGAALAGRLAERGASVALLGLEPELLSELSGRLDGAPWRECDVSDQGQVEVAVEDLVGELGGLDVVVANAGIGAQMTLVGGRHEVMERTLAVNTLGVYYTVSAAGAHVSHPGGYVLLTSSAAAGLHLPLMGAYCASKAAVEAIGDCLRVELLPTGARVGVAYFAEIDTDMTARGMKTEAASRLRTGAPFNPVSPLSVAVDALELGIFRRARRVYAPRWVALVLRLRMPAQRVVERALATSVSEALDVARGEDIDFTTAQPVS